MTNQVTKDYQLTDKQVAIIRYSLVKAVDNYREMFSNSKLPEDVKDTIEEVRDILQIVKV